MSLDLSSNFLQFGFKMANGNGHNIYEFDHFRLDAAKLMLYKGESEVSLPPKVIKTLTVLVENSGEILSKDDLMKRVWEDSVVEESNLSQYLYLLRKTLGNREDGRDYIETLRRRGYRFNGDVRLVPSTLKVNGNSNAKPAAVSVADVSVKRQGNVLRLVDRAPEVLPAFQPEPELSEARQITTTPSKWPMLKLAATVTLIIAAVVLYLWFRPVNARVEAQNEMSVTRLTNGAYPYSIAASRDGKYIVYTEIAGESSQMWLQSVGEANRIKIAESSDKVFGYKTFSPDGRFLYFAMLDKANAENVSTNRMPVMGGPFTKVLDGIGLQVSFSPDGQEIAFARKDASTGASSISLSDKDGRNERTVVTRTTPISILNAPAWSPDGKTIIFSELGPGGSGYSNYNRIYSLDIASGSVRDASQESWDTVYNIEWMRDGKGFVIIGTRENDSYTTRRDQIYYISYPSGVSRRITTDSMRHEPSSLDVTDDGSIVTVMGSRSSQIWSMDVNGDAATAVQITKGMYDGRPGLAPMPDGKVGFITYTSDDPAVWTMNADGSQQSQLTGGPMIVEELRPDPLGRYYIFSSSTDRHNHLYRINADGSGLKQITFGNSFEIDSSVSTDGQWIAYGSAQEKDDGVNRLLRTSIDGGEIGPFGDNQCSRPSYSPDGKYLACVTENDKVVLIISAADGSKVRSFDVAPFATINSGVRWMPDSSAVLYIRSDKDCSNLWGQPLTGEKPRQLTNFTSGIIFNFTFAADGSRIYLARGYPIQEAIMIKNFR